jgi:hypothetical protein
VGQSLVEAGHGGQEAVAHHRLLEQAEGERVLLYRGPDLLRIGVPFGLAQLLEQVEGLQVKVEGVRDQRLGHRGLPVLPGLLDLLGRKRAEWYQHQSRSDGEAPHLDPFPWPCLVCPSIPDR